MSDANEMTIEQGETVRLYNVDFDCPRCGKIHEVYGGLWGGLLVPSGPDHAGTIAELYEGQELPAVLTELMNDLVECETLGQYALIDDPVRVHLTPKRGGIRQLCFKQNPTRS